MKRQRILFKCLAFLFFGLFLILTLYGGYSVATYGNRWFSSNKNPRVRAQKESVIAGDIYDRNGVLLATTDENGNRVYQASEQARRAVVHLLGDSQRNVANGVESFQTAYLYGFHSSFGELLGDFFSGTARRGDNLYLTIDSRLCQRMIESYQNHSSTSGKSGAAVVMNYLTGEILAEISLPTFDPLQVTAGVDADGEPFWNRATQSVYPPGSTFKIVTAASALKYLPELAEEEFECTGDLQLNGHTIHDYGNTVHGRMDLKEAFSVSCNNIFAALAVELTDARLRQTAENFGFNDNFLFKDMVVENSRFPVRSGRSDYEVGASGFGQSSIAASPMHMCMVAAAVGADGVMQEPILLREVQAPSGATRMTWESRVYRKAMEADIAAVMQNYMRYVVTSGTGSRASTRSMIICGKTGTAESTLKGKPVNYGWFVGYVDDPALPFAVSILVENIDDGQGGGSTAAPIARDIFQYLMDYPERVTQ